MQTNLTIDDQYNAITKKIITEGFRKENRTGVAAYTIAHCHLEHDMSHSFPILTTRKLPIKSTLVELEGFLRGITSKKWFEDRKCSFWSYWCNPAKLYKRLCDWQNKYANDYDTGKQLVEASLTHEKEFQKEEDDLGPIYGYQWRNFDKHYLPYYTGGSEQGSDQLKTILNSLHKNPNDRRMVCSAWNPNQQHLMALPPCHILWHITVINDTINLCWFQRSCDFQVGISANIVSYATLLLLLAKQSGLKPGKLSGFLSDVHIYENHLEGAKEQITRHSKQKFNPTTDKWENPQLEITCDKPFEIIDNKLIVNWQASDCRLDNYDPHPPIKYEVAV